MMKKYAYGEKGQIIAKYAEQNPDATVAQIAWATSFSKELVYSTLKRRHMLKKTRSRLTSFTPTVQDHKWLVAEAKKHQITVAELVSSIVTDARMEETNV